MNRSATLARHGTRLAPLRTVYAVSAAALGLTLAIPLGQAHAQDKQDKKDIAPPIVFQAAGPTADSIQSTVDAFRSALGDPNNNNNPGPLDNGRREINWDGGGVDTTTAPVTPFNVFLNTRGASSPHRGRVFRRRPHRAGHRAVLRRCSTIRPMAPSLAPSARSDFSPR